MKEHFLAISGAYKPKSAVADDSFDCALHRHLDLRRGAFYGGSVNIANEVTSRTRWGHCTSTQVLCQRDENAEGGGVDNMSYPVARSHSSSDLNDSTAAPKSS